VPLGPRFQSRNGYLEAPTTKCSRAKPSALLEIFLLLEQNLDLRGVNARTIALVKQHLWLIDEEFRQNPRHHRLFLDILRAPQGVTRTLKRMNTYGVLGCTFRRSAASSAECSTTCSTRTRSTRIRCSSSRTCGASRCPLRQRIPAVQRHDAAAREARGRVSRGPVPRHREGPRRRPLRARRGRCRSRSASSTGMSRYDARLVAWLVQHHLLLSLTAQKKDLNDPNVVNEFARTVGDQTHLDYLYVLTVPTCAARIRKSGTRGRTSCSPSSISRRAARFAAAYRTRSTRKS
jgi:[protein-PII] uridylyltransferase